MGTNAMRVQVGKWSLGLAVAALAFAFAASARADIPKAVQAKFKGQILVTEDPLPEVEDAKEGVKVYGKLNKAAVKGEEADGVMSWTFYYTAFLKKPPKTAELSLDFHTADKEKLYVANKRLQINGELTIIEGKLTITEDDGPSRNKTYNVILRAQQGGKEIEVAKTKLRLE